MRSPVLHATWVFDCDAPLDEFQRRMRAALERNGWVTGPAQVYDFWCARAGARAFVKLAHHDWGVQVAVKVKPGALVGPERFQRDLWEAAREVQVGYAGATAAPTSSGPARSGGL